MAFQMIPKEYMVREESYHTDTSPADFLILRRSLVLLYSCISHVGSRDDQRHEVARRHSAIGSANILFPVLKCCRIAFLTLFYLLPATMSTPKIYFGTGLFSKDQAYNSAEDIKPWLDTLSENKDIISGLDSAVAYQECEEWLGQLQAGPQYGFTIDTKVTGGLHPVLAATRGNVIAQAKESLTKVGVNQASPSCMEGARYLPTIDHCPRLTCCHIVWDSLPACSGRTYPCRGNALCIRRPLQRGHIQAVWPCRTYRRAS